MMDENRSEEAREMQLGISQMENIKSHVEALKGQRDALSSIIKDYGSSLEVVKALEEGSSSEVMVPIGGMTFIKVELKSMDRLMVDQGAGVYIEQDLDSAKNRIQERIDKVKEALDQYDRGIDDLMKRYDEIAKKTQDLYSRQMMSDPGPDDNF
jgi:prefoldin alpha subunit